jgi:tetratricopeptide (TPR) repeat protein
MSGFKRLIFEIHRRSLWQVVAIYIGGAWACYEIIDTITDRLTLPGWLPVLAIVLFLLGLPFVLATAFVREEAPGGPTVAEAARPKTTEADLRAARQAVVARRRVVTWRNLGLAFVAVLAAWGAVAAGWLLLGPGAAGDAGEAAPAVSVARVAVLPFSVRGSEDVAYLGEGMVDLLSTALDGAGELKVVDPYALMKFLTGERDGPIDPRAGEAVANRFGAGRFVLGSIVEAGGRLQVNASLYAADGRVEVSAEEIAEDEAQVFDLVNSVARQLLAAGMGGPNARLTQVAAATTTSLPALKEYLEGESEMRAVRFASAASAYQRAIEADSTFALAYYRLAMAALFSATPTGVMPGQAAAEAVRFGERLSQRDRDRLAVIDFFLSADAAQGERQVRALLRSYPEDMEAWYYLGEFLFHYGARRGRPIAEAGDAFDRVLEYDPDHFMALVHLSWIRAIQQRRADVGRLVSHMAELERESEFPQYSRPARAFLRGGEPAVREILPELRTESVTSLTFGGVFLLSVLDDGVAAAVEIAGLLADPSRSPYERGSAYAVQANLEMAQGHLRAADEAMDRLETLGLPAEFETALEKRAVMWTSPVVPVERAEAEELRERLRDLDYDSVYSPVTRPYLLGLVAVRVGRPAEVLRQADQLESHAARQVGEGSSHAKILAQYFATVLRAQVAYDEGDSEGALRLLEGATADDWWALRPAYLLLSQAYERYLRAQALEALGRDEEALRWYASFGWVSQADALYVAPALLQVAEIYDRLGDAQQAATYYRRFITRWADCDPELRPSLTAAEEALARLTSDAQ